MSAKIQHNNILLAIAGFVTVVIIVAIIGFLVLDRDPDIMQGQVEVSEYRVSSKVPGRILEIRVKEGDYVKVGDTLAILDAPEVRAKMEQAQSAESAAAALELKAQNGARKEQIQGPSPCCSRPRPASRSPRSRTTAYSVFTTRV